MIRVAVVGAGLIGRERLSALASLASEGRPVSIVGVCDANEPACHSAAAEFGTTAYKTVDLLLEQRPDWLMIALPHDTAVSVATDALNAGVSVLMEKPMGRDVVEAEKLKDMGGDRLRIGFNYRFYGGIVEAMRDLRAGRFGKVVSVQFNLGHGCAPGQEKTWKLDAMRAGGGCLIDPGVHLLDLCLQIAPAGLQVVGGTSWSGFWKTGIEEEVSVMLRSGDITFDLRISLLAWRSTFQMQINGTEGYGIVSGRNRSYGQQSYVTGKRWGWRDAPSQAASEEVRVVDDGLDVFKRETEALLFGNDSSQEWPRMATVDDGLAVMRLLDDIRSALNLRRNYAD